MYTHDYQWDHESSEEFASGAIAIDAPYIDTKGNTICSRIDRTVYNDEEEVLITTFPWCL